MPTTVVAMYASEESAQAARDELGDRFPDHHLLRPGDGGSALTQYGIPETAEQSYQEGLQRGLFLVAVRVPRAEANAAGRILDRHDPVQTGERTPHGGRPLGLQQAPQGEQQRDLRLEQNRRLADESAFQAHFEREYAGRLTWGEVAPAYHYGQELALHAAYRNRGWEEVEPEARQVFRRQDAGRWEIYQGAIRYAFERARGLPA